MTGSITASLDTPQRRDPRVAPTRNRSVGARTLIGVALAFLTLFLFVPLAAVFARRCARASTCTRIDRRCRRAVGHQADAADIARSPSR
jgi:hypothetical protein